MAEMIEVEVVYALAERQALVRLQVPQGTTVRQAALAAGLEQQFAGLELAQAPLGIFGKQVTEPDSRELQAGERVEVYRPLLLDPKEIRKQRAAKAKQARGE